MKVIVTGLNGTVAPVLASALRRRGHVVVPWDREIVQPVDLEASKRFIDIENPDVVAHIATGPVDWAENLAILSQQTGRHFLFTSSVSVFGDSQVGPFALAEQPIPDSDYGRYKLEAEQRISTAHPSSTIARLGWQIGTSKGGNHMVDFLLNTVAREGRVRASRNWYQACSMLTDTAEVLSDLIETRAAGLYHVDGNHGLSFLEVVTGLRKYFQTDWAIEEADEPVLNNMLVDERISIRKLGQVFEAH